MRLVPLFFCTLGLLGSEPLRIVAVERHGPPPYEDDQRIYRLQGQSRASPGEILELSRSGGRALPGRLRVLQSTPEGVLATLDRRGDTYPLKGDLARHWEMAGLPGLPPTRALLEIPTAPLSAPGIPRDPRRLWEALYFLPGDANLSPLGRAKLDAWAREFGPGGWTLEIPLGKGPPARLDSARVKVLKAALETAGIKGVQIKVVHPLPGQRADAVYIRYQESAPAKVVRFPKA